MREVNALHGAYLLGHDFHEDHDVDSLSMLKVL